MMAVNIKEKTKIQLRFQNVQVQIQRDNKISGNQDKFIAQPSLDKPKQAQKHSNVEITQKTKKLKIILTIFLNFLKSKFKEKSGW